MLNSKIGCACRLCPIRARCICRAQHPDVNLYALTISDDSCHEALKAYNHCCVLEHSLLLTSSSSLDVKISFIQWVCYRNSVLDKACFNGGQPAAGIFLRTFIQNRACLFTFKERKKHFQHRWFHITPIGGVAMPAVVLPVQHFQYFSRCRRKPLSKIDC